MSRNPGVVPRLPHIASAILRSVGKLDKKTIARPLFPGLEVLNGGIHPVQCDNPVSKAYSDERTDNG